MWGNTALEGGLAQPSHVWMIILNVIQSNALALNRFWHTGLHPNWQSEFCSRLHMIEISLNGWGPPSDKVTYQRGGGHCSYVDLTVVTVTVAVTVAVTVTVTVGVVVVVVVVAVAVAVAVGVVVVVVPPFACDHQGTYDMSFLFSQLRPALKLLSPLHGDQIQNNCLSLPKPTLDTNRVDLVLVQCFI